MKFRRTAPAAVLALLLLSALPVRLRAEGTREGAEPFAGQPLRVGILPDVDSVPLVMARELGFYEEAGVRVELVSFGNPVNRDSALQAGEIDGAVSDLLAVAFARRGRFALSAVAATDGSYKLLGSGVKGVSSMERLEGAEVALSRNTIIEYCTDRILEAAGRGPEYIRKVSIPQIPVRLEMLKSGGLDGATLPEPLASAALASGAFLIGSSDALGIDPGVLVFSREAIDHKPGEIGVFLDAVDAAVDWLESGGRNGMERIAEAAGFPAETAGAMVLPRYSRAALPEEKEVEEVVEWLFARSLIDEKYRYQDLVDRSFLQE